LAESNDAVLAPRREVLRGLKLEESDAFANERCPGILLPADAPADRSACPKEGRIEDAILALPRRPEARDSAAIKIG